MLRGNAANNAVAALRSENLSLVKRERECERERLREEQRQGELLAYNLKEMRAQIEMFNAVGQVLLQRDMPTDEELLAYHSKQMRGRVETSTGGEACSSTDIYSETSRNQQQPLVRRDVSVQEKETKMEKVSKSKGFFSSLLSNLFRGKEK